VRLDGGFRRRDDHGRQPLDGLGDQQPEQVLPARILRPMHPCREGSPWMAKISDRIVAGNASPDDVDMLEQVANQIEGKTICAFGEAASWPTQSFVRKFRDEIKSATKSDLSGKIVNEETALAAAG